MEITHRFVETNGIRLEVAEAGDGPLVLLCHGFPETAHSWRHQLAALAAAGYHAVAPNQRGYGRSDAPERIESYSMLQLAGDIIGLAAALGAERFCVAGHDWGSPVAASVALFRPDLVRGVALLSVPYLPRGETDVLSSLTELLGPDNYQAYYQVPGVAEELLEADVRSSMRSMLLNLSGDAERVELLDGVTGADMLPDMSGVPLPAWLSEADLDAYVADFEHSGFRGPLNWYRTSMLNWEMTAPWKGAPLLPPSLYIGGDRDVVYNWPGMSDAIGVLRELSMPSLTKAVVLEGCGHWTQQERAADVNELLTGFVSGLPD